MRSVEITGNKGNMTVEAALVVPLVLLVLFVLMYASMIVYQWVLITRTASRVAQQGSEIWTDSRKSLDTGSWNRDMEKDPLYYQIFNDSLFGMEPGTFQNPFKEVVPLTDDWSNAVNAALQEAADTGKSLQSRKVAQIRAALYKGLSKGVLRPVSTEIAIQYDNCLVQRKLDIILTQEFKIPFGNFASLFGRNPTFSIHGKGTAVVTEPAEYIRNVDLGIEFAYRARETLNIDGKLSDLINKLKGMMSH